MEERQGQSSLQVITISAARGTKWQPEIAQLLLLGLFAIPRPFKLLITATGTEIRWSVEIDVSACRALLQTLHARYPQAQVVVEPKGGAPVHERLYRFHAAAAFVAPIKHAQDHSKSDPLAPLLGAMGDLFPDEEIVYELALRPPRQDYRKLGRKLITTSTVAWWHFLTFGLTAEALAKKAVGKDKADRFAPEIQKAANAKLNAPLKEVNLSVKIRAPSRARSDELIDRFGPALAVFEREGFNRLVPARSGSYPLILSAPEAAALWHLPSDQCETPGIAWARSATAPVPTAVASRKPGILLGSNVYQGRSKPVWLAYPDRVTHVNVIGKTGVGKSTLFHHMIHQDILAGKGVALIDPHGDLADRIIAASIPAEREGDVILFDMSDSDYPIGLNFFAAPANITPATIAGMALAVIRKMFADSWSATRMEDALYAALMALQSVEGATIRDVARLFHDSSFRSQVLGGITDPVVLEFWNDEFEPLGARHQAEFARPITNRLRKFYRNPQIGRVVGQTHSLDFREIMDSGRVFLAKLTGIPEIEAETLGALLISKFQLAAMSRMQLAPERRQPYYPYIDEVQNLSTTSLAKLFSEARKTGLNLVVANQFLKQLEGPTLESILGNVGTMVVFPVGPKDAAILSSFVCPQFSSEDLVNLSRFNAVVKMQLTGTTQPAFSLQPPPPLPLPDDADERFERIRAKSRRKYARHKDEVDAELLEKYQTHQQVNRPGFEGAEGEDYFG